MEKKHEFFDSGLLYHFCINFRRRRRLSELLNKSEPDVDGGVSASAAEDNHLDSPFSLRKNQPQEENAVFQSGELKTNEFNENDSVKNSPSLESHRV